MCPPEKGQDNDPHLCQAVHSPQSGLRTKYCGIWACFAYFGISGGGNSLQLRLAGGEGGIRTPDTLSGMPVFKTGAINHSATSPDYFIFITVDACAAGEGSWYLSPPSK
jgi:hypothetical protein